MKKYIRRVIASDTDLQFREAGTSAADVRRSIVARAAARVNRAVTRRPVGQKLELVATSSNYSATNVAASAAAAKAAAAAITAGAPARDTVLAEAMKAAGLIK